VLEAEAGAGVRAATSLCRHKSVPPQVCAGNRGNIISYAYTIIYNIILYYIILHIIYNI